LHGATENGNKAMVELLLSRGADVNAADGFGRTALHIAAEKGFLAVAEVLLAHHADLNARDSQSNGERTPLHLAAERGNVEMLKWLIARGADINARSKNGSTPLGDAASAGQLDSIRVLLAAKADPDNADNYGRTPMSYAAEGNNLEVVKILLAAKADPNGGKLDAPLLCAVHKQNTVAAELLLQAGANPNVKGGMDWQVTIGNIMHGGINPRDRAECTPLYLAISTEQLPMVNLLLKFKADPNDSQTDGRPLLFSALSNTNILKVLLDAGAKVDVRDKNVSMNGVRVNWTLLDAAILEKDIAAVKTLLEHGADPNAHDASGNMALHWAANPLWSQLTDRKLFELLLDHGANPNVRNDDGYTPLDLVKRRLAQNALSNDTTNASAIADLFRQHGALDNLPNWDRIIVSRPSANFGRTVFRKGTNDWNQFTLFELMAAYYGFVSTKSVPDSAEQEFNPDSYTIQGSLAFPDLEKVTIQRPMANGREWKKINVDLVALFASGDCSRDVRLEWGDQVVIPEADHPIDADWYGLPDKAKTTLENCLKRQVQLSVNNQITNVVLTLHASRGTSYSVGPYGRIMVRSSQFSLVPVLTGSGLLRTSSDLSHVKVNRRSPATGKKLEWTLDCSGDHAPDLWLRDGDVIEVPEK
jgi:ankyrin repeat protein